MYKILKKIFPSVGYLAFSLKNAGLYVGAALILKILSALIPTMQAVALGKLVDTALAAFTEQNLSPELKSAFLLLCILILFDHLIAGMYQFILAELEVLVGTACELQVLEKRSRLTIAEMEDSEICEMLERVTEDSADKMYSGFLNLTDILEYAVRILGIVAAICSHSTLVGIFAAILLAGTLLLAKKCGEDDYKAYKNSADEFRRSRYFRDVLRGRDYVGEREVFQYTDWMNELWEHSFEKGRCFSEKVSRQNYIRIKMISIVTLLFGGIVSVALLFPLLGGRMSTGSYIGIVTLITTFAKMMEWNIAYVVEDFISGRLYILDYDRFLGLEECMIMENDADNQLPLVNEIVFKDVSFKYPGTDKPVLHHLDLTLKQGRQYAFVGENGAGKTTLVQILLGLYDKYQGEILLDGKELRDFSPEERKRYFACAWQNFAQYEISLEENISLGKKIHRSDLNALCERLGMGDLPKQLPDGFETELGRLGEYGIDLSGGQWQKIAVARAIARKAPILILDEPAAALDPSGEQALYTLLQRQIVSSIGIWITHRLGGICGVDEIVVLKDGSVCECGSHKELMAKHGLYAQMFETQRNWYDEKRE